MNRSHHPRRRALSLISYAILLILFVSAASFALAPRSGPYIARAEGEPSPERLVQQAWRRAAEAGAYDFATEIVQTTYPAPALTNLGETSHEETLYLEGRTDLAERSMRMTLWKEGGSVMTRRDGIELRIEGDEAFGRQIGGAWQEVDDFSGAFAPGKDLLGYLVGARSVERVGRETRRLVTPNGDAQVTVTRYAFELDGRTFAQYLRDQLESTLRERGELPLGLTLDTPRQYLETSGRGEVWLDEGGLPARLSIELAYPPGASGERVEAVVRSDFSGFATLDAPAADAGILGRAVGMIGLPTAAEGWRHVAEQAALITLLFGLLGVMVIYRRSKKVYTVLALIIILSTVVGPLLHSQQVHAFAERMTAQRAEEEQRQRGEAAARDLEAELRNADWRAHGGPLASAPQPKGLPHRLASSGVRSANALAASGAGSQKSLDQDGDGLIDGHEQFIGSDPANPDSDGDGLSDGVEVHRLGTNPTLADTDEDTIPDAVEVLGFEYAGQDWYLDPLSPDTNGDGRLDGLECSGLIGLDGAGTEKPPVSCDLDRDDVPNVFDHDDDGDGVPDSVDLSPEGLVDRAGKRSRMPGSVSPFNRDHPFSLMVTELNDEKPVFVDLQLRPVVTRHLSYAMNVLDWPSEDVDGQIQRVKSTTFASSDNPQVRDTSDPRAKHGDMRLIPMLEIEIPGNSVPFKLTRSVDVELRGAISATVTLEQSGQYLDSTYSFADNGSYDYTLNKGSCGDLGAPLLTSSDVQHGDTSRDPNRGLVGVTDGNHAMTLEGGGESVCADVPAVPNGPYSRRVIDLSVLKPYGISVREDKEGALLAYVPLNVQADDTGGGKAAFSARMLYWPGTNRTWARPQTMRVVWMVQMLTDWCDTAGFQPSEEAQKDAAVYGDELAAYCEAPHHRTMDLPQIVQTYDEDWYLTGLAVREEHGMDVAVAYPNPDLAYDEDPLWSLALGLSSSFLTARDEDGNGIRDIGVAIQHADTTIEGRFGAGSAYSETERWGITPGALQVSTTHYRHQDYVGRLAMTETPRILGQFDHGEVPTLLFAREEHYHRDDLGAASLGGGTLTVATGNAHAAQTQTAASLKWATYRYNTAPGPDGQMIGWESYPTGRNWDRLEIDLTGRFMAQYPEDDQLVNVGRMVVARGFYVSMLQGVVSQVENEDGPLSDVPGWLTDSELRSRIKSTGLGLLSVVKTVAAETYENMKPLMVSQSTVTIVDATTGEMVDFTEETVLKEGFLRSLGKGIRSFAITPWTSLYKYASKATLAGAGLVVGGAIAVIGITAYAASTANSGVEVASQVLLGASILMKMHGVVRAFSSVVKTAQNAGTTIARTVKNNLSSLKGITKGMKSNLTKMAVVGLVVGIVATWAAFAVQAGLSGGMSGREWGTAIAGAIASTIVAVIMFAISVIPVVGQLIGAIIGLIDSFISMICSAFLSEEQQESEAGQWLCGGLQGIVSKALQVLIYSTNVMVDLTPDDYQRLTFGGLQGDDLVDPQLGFSVGNKIRYGVSVTNTIRLIDIPANMGAAWAYEYTDNRLRSSTFEYQVQSEEVDFHEELEKGETIGWLDVSDPEDAIAIAATVNSEDGLPISQPGVNAPASFILSEAYAVPVQDCVLGVCAIGTERGTEHYDIGATLRQDVFPATLDGFYAANGMDRGYRLAWSTGISGTLAFPVQQDFDGDGLNRWVDPDDSDWDSDGDGLSDGYEVRVGGSPTLRDTDGDGLGDYEEARAGTGAHRPDTDGDGLLDGQEVWHQDAFDAHPYPPGEPDGDTTEWVGGWEVVYATSDDGAPRATWVTSDPLDVDADSDTLTDFQEWTYGLHPQVRSNPQVLSLESTLHELPPGQGLVPSDGLVKPGDDLYYSAEVKNELNNRYAHGLLDTEFPGVLEDEALTPESFVLYPQQAETIRGHVPVVPSAATGVYSLTQTAGGVMVDWSLMADDAQLWLPFEDPPLADKSGNLPPHDGTCHGSCPTPDLGPFGSAVYLDGDSWVTSPVDPSETAYAVSLWFRTRRADAALLSVQDDSGAKLFLNKGSVCGLAYTMHQIQSWPTSIWMPIPEAVCSETGYADNEWHHVVHTLGDTIGGQRLYVDGALVAVGANSSMPANQAGISIGHSETLDVANFSGFIDDVRLYDDDLTQDEVQTLFSQPVFHMTFDTCTGLAQDWNCSDWPDSSVFDNDGVCTSAVCPESKPGVSGQAARLYANSGISVDGDASLNLSDGRFTLAAWIRPAVGTGKHGILGETHSLWTDPQAYPTLQQVDRKIRFGFGTGTAWKGYTSRNLLRVNRWNHVVVTYDKGTMRLYVDGDLKVENDTRFGGALPTDAVTNFHVGRTSAPGRPAAYEFNGWIDEVQIQRRVLGEADVEELFQEGTSALYLRLDEVPGAARFEDASGGHQARCTADSSCATSGVSGRLNQAALFDGDDALQLPHGPANELTKDFTVAAWIRPSETAGRQRIVAAARTNSTNGYGFGIRAGDLWFQAFGENQYRLQGSAIEAGEWQHVAAVMDRNNDVTFYINGQSQGTVTGSAPVAADTDDVLLIGATTDPANGTREQHFKGAMDDVRIIRRALAEGELREIYHAAPVFQMQFEERHGATTFVDAADAGNDGTCAGENCPAVGHAIEGRLGNGAAFDGLGDGVQVEDDPALRQPGEFSVGVWVMPNEDRQGDQDLVGKYHIADNGSGGVAPHANNYRLYIKDKSLTPAFSVGRGCDWNESTQDVVVESDAQLVQGVWNHVMGTFEIQGGGMRRLTIYVNGSEQGTRTYNLVHGGGRPCDDSTVDLRIGSGGYEQVHTHWYDFGGRLDEVTVYRRALAEAEIREMFRYQGSWVQDRQSHNITVDDDVPSVGLVTPGTYLPRASVQMVITTTDRTSYVDQVSLLAEGAGHTWEVDAPRCSDGVGDTTWCPTFVPRGEGVHTLRARATDAAGNEAFSAWTTVFVDDAPPDIGFDFEWDARARVDAYRHPTRRHAWVVRLSGTVDDPTVPGAEGSGVDADSVWVTLFRHRPQAAEASMGRQQAAVSPLGSWTVDYVLDEPNPSGVYEVRVEAADQVAATPELAPEHVDDHTRVARRSILVDGTPPGANLNVAALPSTMISDTTPLVGGVSERAALVDLDWTTLEGSGDQVGVTLTCGGTTLHDVSPGTLAPEARRYGWTGWAERGAACRVDVVGDASGGIRVCGDEVESWAAGTASIGFIAMADSCVVQPAVSGVDAVELAWMPTLPGSPFYSQGFDGSHQVLHLPMDHSAAANGNLVFADVSGLGHDGTCPELRCPSVGHTGHTGDAALFDGRKGGVAVDIAGSTDFDVGEGPFALAMWVLRRGEGGHLLNWQPSTPDSWFGITLEGSTPEVELAGYQDTDFVREAVLLSTDLGRDTWHHLVVVREDDETLRVYLDGEEAGQTTSDLPVNSANLGSKIWIGGPRRPSTWAAAFDGLIDEVRFFARDLSPQEVETLYRLRPHGPILELPFDRDWAVDGKSLDDWSGAAHHGTLHTGDPFNKTVYGQVGPYALQLDGVDDYVGVGPEAGLDLRDGRFTQAAWVHVGADGDDIKPIVSGAARASANQQYPFLEVVNGTRLRAGFGDGTDSHSVTTGDVLSVGTWHHVASTYDGTTYRIYVDGVETAANDGMAGSKPVAAQAFDVGRGASGGPDCGTLDLQTIVPHACPYAYQIWLDGERVYQTRAYPSTDQPLTIGRSREICGDQTLEVRWLDPYGNATSAGKQTVVLERGLHSHRFAGDFQATVSWEIVADPASETYFAGQLDDVRVYARALSALEIQALHQSGWQEAALDQSGAGVDHTTWTDHVPEGLEGSYRLDVRGRDTADHVDTSAQSRGLWRGEVDTLGPRVSLLRETVGSTYLYTATAEDFNLTEEGFTSPCGVGVVTEREVYQTPWYRPLAQGEDRLYRLTAACEVPSGDVQGEVGAYDTPGLARAVALSRDYAFVADRDAGLRVVDISDPEQPRPVGAYNTPGDARDVVISGDPSLGSGAAYAYVADADGGLQIIDVSTPSAPTVVGTFSDTKPATGIALSGTHALVADKGGLHAIDVSDPTAPTFESWAPNLTGAREVAIAGSYAYVAGGDNGLWVIDISSPSEVTRVGQYTETHHAWDVAVSGDPSTGPGSTYAYVADGGAGLRILDVSDPSAPELAAIYDTRGYAKGVTISGTLAYVADAYAGLVVVDVSDPSNPQLETRVDHAGWALDVAVGPGGAAGPYAYMAARGKGLRVVLPFGVEPRATACDTAGNCTTAVPTVATVQRVPISVAAAAESDPPEVAIMNVPWALNTTDPVEVAGRALATVSTLEGLTLTVDGTVVHTETWASEAVTEAIWSTTWTPTSEGRYSLKAIVTDAEGHVASDSLTVTVDTQSPQIAIATTLFTSTHLHPPSRLDLTGSVTDTGGVAAVRVGIGEGTSSSVPATIDGGTWRAPWHLGTGPLPDGATYTVSAEATDIVGRNTRVTETVLVDVVPPSPVTLTLSSDGDELRPFALLTETVPVTLTLGWTPSGDGSGLDDYQVQWSAWMTAAATVSETAVPSTGHTAVITAGDGQKVVAQLGSQDVHGNQRWQSAGPVYIDGPQTPDYVMIEDPDGVFHGWMDNGCTLVGVDRRAARRASDLAALDAEQRLYATWGAEGLRLAWTGANWNTDGDLFIYLDTGSGGATEAFAPYAAGTSTTTVGLPEGMGADTVIWVRDADTAQRFRWGASRWVYAETLPSAQYSYDPVLNDGQTDLYLPFDGLGINDPNSTSLGLVAFATEEAAMQLWAALPNLNPLNSNLAVETAPSAGAGDGLTLTSGYDWSALGSGVCPNGSVGDAGSRYADVELELGLTVEPNGLTYGLLSDDLFWLRDVLLGGTPEEIEAALGHLGGDDQPVADGQTVTYTIHLHNRGSDPMTGLTADVTPRYGLRLGDSCPVTATYSLPDVDAGAYVTDTFTGLVDAACSSEPWAGVAVDVRGPSDQLWDRLWAQHAVDQTPPTFFGIQQPRYVVGVGLNPVLGYAYDAAGIAEVGLEAQLPGEPAEIVACPDNTPHDGAWACNWSVAADHGDTVSATLHVTDTLGQSAAWAKPLPFLVDARPPTLTFDVTSTQVVSGSLVRGAAFSVYGEVRDDGGVGTVDVCLDGTCAPATLLTTVGTRPLALEDAPESPVAMSAGAPCITRTFTISEDFAIAEANLGVVISHAHRHDLQATLTSPRGATSAVLCGETDPANIRAHYDVSFGDSALQGVYAGARDHDPGLPYYENVVRPCQPLRVFQGERSAGDWKLRICDLDPGAGEGAYVRGHLELTPRDAAPHAGRWSHRTPAIPGSDWTTHTITIHAEDVAGNRTGDELSMVFTVDSEAPVITVTRVLTEIQLAETAALVQRVSHPDFLLGIQPGIQPGIQRMMASSARTVMWATISESGPAVGVSAHVHAPDGSTLREQVARSGDVYWLDLEPQQEGLHTLWLEAKDQAGNTSTAGPFDIEVLGRPEQEDEPQPVGGYAWAPGRSLLRLAALRLAVLTVVMTGLLLVGATVLRRSRRRR